MNQTLYVDDTHVDRTKLMLYAMFSRYGSVLDVVWNGAALSARCFPCVPPAADRQAYTGRASLRAHAPRGFVLTGWLAGGWLRLALRFEFAESARPPRALVRQ